MDFEDREKKKIEKMRIKLTCTFLGAIGVMVLILVFGSITDQIGGKFTP